MFMLYIDFQNNTETPSVASGSSGSGMVFFGHRRFAKYLMNTITAVVSLAIAFCPLASAWQQKDEQMIRGIDAAWSQALQGKDLDKVMSNYAEEASFLPPDEPIVQGRGNIREWFAKRMALPGYSATFSPTTVVVSKSRDIAYELGTFQVTINDESGKPVLHLGKHLVTWQKRSGHWKVVAESINRDSPSVQR
jgi:ketosteroid isomerase-like protein